VKNSSLRAGQRYAKSETMPTDRTPSDPPTKGAAENPSSGPRRLTPEAERALAEAAARRAEEARQKAETAKELAGRGGLEPTRYGDWEINGIISDF
jgi:hypothetical protein